MLHVHGVFHECDYYAGEIQGGASEYVSELEVAGFVCRWEAEGEGGKREEARIKWCEELGKMKGRVFAAVGRVLEEKVAEWKRWDSNTYTSKVKSVKGDVELLAEWLGGTSL